MGALLHVFGTEGFPPRWTCGDDRADARAMRQREEAELVREIDEVLVESRRTYGSPRIGFELLDRGYRVGRQRIARVTNKNDSILTPKTTRSWVQNILKNTCGMAAGQPASW